MSRCIGTVLLTHHRHHHHEKTRGGRVKRPCYDDDDDDDDDDDGGGGGGRTRTSHARPVSGIMHDESVNLFSHSSRLLFQKCTTPTNDVNIKLFFF